MIRLKYVLFHMFQTVSIPIFLTIIFDYYEIIPFVIFSSITKAICIDFYKYILYIKMLKKVWKR